MKRFRVTIFGLMAVVLASALAFAALKTANVLWLLGLSGTTWLALAAVSVAARVRPGREGTFWFGAAVFGWVAFLPLQPPFASELNPVFDLCEWIASALTPDPPPGPVNVGDVENRAGLLIWILGDLIAWGSALIGGLFALLIRPRERKEPS